LDVTGFLLGSKIIGYPATNNKNTVIKIYSCHLATKANSKDGTNYFGRQLWWSESYLLLRKSFTEIWNRFSNSNYAAENSWEVNMPNFKGSLYATHGIEKYIKYCR